MGNTTFRLSGYIGYALLFISILVILYWVLGFVPEGRVSTKANTGFCFLLLAIQLIINSRKQNQLLWYHLIPSASIIIIASLSFVENIFGADYLIDHILSRSNQTSFDLMSTGTAVSFILLGSASFLLGKNKNVTNQAFAIMNNIVQIIILIAFISHIFAPLEINRPSFWSTMSLLTCFLFLISSIGLSFLRPDIGFVRVLRSKELGSIIARRLVIIIMLTTIVLGALLYYFYQQQIVSVEFRFVFLIAISMVLALMTTAYLETLIRRLESDRNKLNVKLKQTLHENEELLKELHHRIKNNLQLISSLLYIQSSTTKDDTFKHFLIEINGRIQAMYTIHEFLLQRKVTDTMNVSEYLTSLSRQLITSYGKTEKQFSLDLSCEEVEMDPDLAFNIGIIFNETILCLIKNTLISQSNINVTLTADENDIFLTFKDSLPEEPDKFLNSFKQSIYIQNLEVFVNLLKGKLDYYLDAHFKILITLTNQSHLMR